MGRYIRISNLCVRSRGDMVSRRRGYLMRFHLWTSRICNYLIVVLRMNLEGDELDMVVCS